MIDLFVYKCLEKINDISTKLTSWSWTKLWADRERVMEIDEDKKIAKILKKANRNKPQFGLASVPTYGKGS